MPRRGRALGERKDDWVGCCRRFQAQAVKTGITIMRNRAIAWQNPEITHDELLRTFVPVHLQEMAKLVVKHFGTAAIHYQQWECGSPKMQIAIRYDDADWAPPKQKVLLPGPGLDKLTAWCEWRYARGCEWGLVRAVWDRLNDLCEKHWPGSNRLHVVRYLWPTVMTLLEVGGEPDEATKLRSARPPEELPRIYPELREAMRITAGTVAAATLLPAKFDNVDDDWPVTLETQEYRGPKPKLDGTAYSVM
jgi:hypothetical protein